LEAGLDVVKGDLPLFPRDPADDDRHLTAAIDWLCHSQDVTGGGGSAASYNLLLGWEPPYPETTGYIIPTMFAYAAAVDTDRTSERAIAMADWLCETQQPSGGFPGGTGAEGEPNVFNTGQIVLGLVSAYRETNDDRYLAATREACDWLVEEQTDDGYWDTHDYNGEAHAYSTRIAWGLTEAATIIPEQRDTYREVARRNLQWALELQRHNGWFRQAGFTAGATPYLHTIAYTIRGLLEVGVALEHQAAIDAAKRTADKLLAIQQRDGILKGAYDRSWSPAWYYCLTGNAQMAIIWLRLFDLTGEREYRLSARNTIEFLKRRQLLDGPESTHGALPGSYPLLGPYMYFRLPNWGVKFFADALLAARGHGLAAGTRTTARKDGRASREQKECQVCLLSDGDTVQRWVADAITEMTNTTNASISLVVINEAAGTFGPEKIKRGKKYPAYALYWTANQLADQVRSGKEYKQPVPISELPGCADVRRIRTYPANVDGLWSELPDEVVEEIDARCDIVFRRGFGLVTGDLLSATEHGVLSYHHGNPRAYRGGPAGFWEYMHDERTAGMMVQRLSSELDAGTVLAYDEIDISECESWGEIRASLYTNSTELLATAVERVQDGTAAPMDDHEPGPINTPPNARTLAAYLSKRYR
jgi:folate-dependent phosphoribosylglycinamide formyltransferase PurN/prenyltransferase beta subunit